MALDRFVVNYMGLFWCLESITIFCWCIHYYHISWRTYSAGNEPLPRVKQTRPVPSAFILFPRPLTGSHSILLAGYDTGSSGPWRPLENFWPDGRSFLLAMCPDIWIWWFFELRRWLKFWRGSHQERRNHSNTHWTGVGTVAQTVSFWKKACVQQWVVYKWDNDVGGIRKNTI